jgi:hypothetical protein
LRRILNKRYPIKPPWIDKIYPIDIRLDNRLYVIA